MERRKPEPFCTGRDRGAASALRGHRTCAATPAAAATVPTARSPPPPLSDPFFWSPDLRSGAERGCAPEHSGSRKGRGEQWGLQGPRGTEPCGWEGGQGPGAGVAVGNGTGTQLSGDPARLTLCALAPRQRPPPRPGLSGGPVSCARARARGGAGDPAGQGAGRPRGADGTCGSMSPTA